MGVAQNHRCQYSTGLPPFQETPNVYVPKSGKMMMNVRGTPQAAACWKKNLLRVVPLVAQPGISWGFNGD